MTASVSTRQRVVEGLQPAWFALVMATGIVSRAAGSYGWTLIATALLWIALIAFVVLIVGTLARFYHFRAQAIADALDPARGFTYLTFPAAAGVLATALGRKDLTVPALVLLAVAALAWLALGYGIPSGLMGRRGGSALAGANGSWFLWVVATQAVAVAATALPQPWARRLAVLALLCWSVGIVLYLLVATLVLGALFTGELDPVRLAPTYWVFMGATAISVLAAAQLLNLPEVHLVSVVRPLLAGCGVVLWAFGSWLIPLLLAAGVWRHVVQHLRLAYEPGLWSIVFPIGMYGVGTRELGTVLEEHWMVTLGGAEAWVAVGAWLATVIALVLSLTRRGN